MKIYFITSCKPITSHSIYTIQKNAINSWKWILVDKEILVFNKDSSVKDFCKELDVSVIDEYESSDYSDLPTWRAMRNYLLNKIEKDDYIVWVNSDIIFDDSLIKTINSLKKDYDLNNFILTGYRKKWHDWFELFDREMMRQINLSGYGTQYQIDYLVFNDKYFRDMSKFYIARFNFDPYLLHCAISSEKFTIDCTEAIKCIEQCHKYGDNLSEDFNLIKDPHIQEEVDWNFNVCRPHQSIDCCNYKIFLSDDKIYFK